MVVVFWLAQLAHGREILGSIPTTSNLLHGNLPAHSDDANALIKENMKCCNRLG